MINVNITHRVGDSTWASLWCVGRESSHGGVSPEQRLVQKENKATTTPKLSKLSFIFCAIHLYGGFWAENISGTSVKSSMLTCNWSTSRRRSTAVNPRCDALHLLRIHNDFNAGLKWFSSTVHRVLQPDCRPINSLRASSLYGLPNMLKEGRSSAAVGRHDGINGSSVRPIKKEEDDIRTRKKTFLWLQWHKKWLQSGRRGTARASVKHTPVTMCSTS